MLDCWLQAWSATLHPLTHSYGIVFLTQNTDIQRKLRANRTERPAVVWFRW